MLGWKRSTKLGNHCQEDLEVVIFVHLTQLCFGGQLVLGNPSTQKNPQSKKKQPQLPQSFCRSRWQRWTLAPDQHVISCGDQHPSFQSAITSYSAGEAPADPISSIQHVFSTIACVQPHSSSPWGCRHREPKLTGHGLEGLSNYILDKTTFAQHVSWHMEQSSLQELHILLSHGHVAIDRPRTGLKKAHVIISTDIVHVMHAWWWVYHC